MAVIHILHLILILHLLRQLVSTLDHLYQVFGQTVSLELRAMRVLHHLYLTRSTNAVQMKWQISCPL